ncbi:tail completion protein gp17 [Sphingobium arseniciresistens]|uniref:tail completion protein gp17 n=1 Tax=Sphingobium arseniciresistens TaxID=3030834 RepID=UPI003BB150B5
MALDSSIYVRKAVMAALKGNAALTSLVPAARIYPATTLSGVQWPFVMYGSDTATPIRMACVDGMEMPFSFQAYAKPAYDGSRMIETAEDRVIIIGAAISAAIDRQTLTLASPYPAKARIRWVSTSSRIAGAETDAWRAIVSFRARVMSQVE